MENNKMSEVTGSSRKGKAKGKGKSNVNGEDEGNKVQYTWTEGQGLSLMVVLKEYHDKNGYNTHYDWAMVNKEFSKKTGIDLKQYGRTVARNKVEHMKKKWKYWCDLRFKVIGAGWDQTSGIVTMDDDSCDSIRKGPYSNCYQFKTKGVDPVLCRLWDEVFGNTTAIGEKVISPSMLKSMGLNKRAIEYGINEDDDEKEEANQNGMALLSNDHAFENTQNTQALFKMVRFGGPIDPPSLDETHNTTLTPLSTSKGHAKPKNKANQKVGKVETLRERLKRRCKSADSIMNEHMQLLSGTGTKMLSILEGTCDSNIGGNKPLAQVYDFDDCYPVIERLVQQNLIEEESRIWCFAISKLGDEYCQHVFMKFPKDSMRVFWLQFEFDRDTKK